MRAAILVVVAGRLAAGVARDVEDGGCVMGLLRSQDALPSFASRSRG